MTEINVRSIALYGSEIWTVFGALPNMMLEKNGEDNMVREEVLEHIGEKRTLLNNVIHRKSN